MDRRDVLAAGVGAGLLALTHTACAQDKNQAPPPPQKEPPPAPAQKGLSPLPAGLLDAIATCTTKAEACSGHAQTQLAAGDTAFAHCAAAVLDMLEVGHAAQSLIARRSPNAKKMAEMCVAACKDCSAGCAEHKAHFAHGMHIECKECMEACDACEKACAAFAAS